MYRDVLLLVLGVLAAWNHMDATGDVPRKDDLSGSGVVLFGQLNDDRIVADGRIAYHNRRQSVNGGVIQLRHGFSPVGVYAVTAIPRDWQYWTRSSCTR